LPCTAKAGAEHSGDMAPNSAAKTQVCFLFIA
jgi:hypothetical protein